MNFNSFVLCLTQFWLASISSVGDNCTIYLCHVMLNIIKAIDSFQNAIDSFQDEPITPLMIPTFTIISPLFTKFP